MDNIIGRFDKNTLDTQLQLSNLNPLAVAYCVMTGYSVLPSKFSQRFGAERGVVQIYFPGPIFTYEAINGVYAVNVFHNGNQKQTEEFNRLVKMYSENAVNSA